MRRLQAKRWQLRERQQVFEEFRPRPSCGGGVVLENHIAEAKKGSARLFAKIRKGMQQVGS